ncbi:hypothetical protein [Dyella sp. 2HG41-7]|uniref:hypothetical protein n=1 Tax=Dyella sp. 2HG41-7 TaxID=2883239 RepID=UPI001F4257A9|nr:hypothetical protein [Dyella sp. 2HG41-7]
MKASLKTRPARGVKASRVLVALMPLILFLAGCNGTLQTQSINPSDTVFRWKPQMDALPIEVHGSVQRLGSEELAKQIPNGTTPDQYAATANAHGKLANAPRVVLYVDAEQGASNETYCNASQVEPSATKAGDENRIVAALCDGPRLIDLTVRDVRDASIQNDGIAPIVKAMKHRLVYGLSVGDYVVPAEYGNG